MKIKLAVILLLFLGFIATYRVMSQTSAIIELNSDGSWNWIATPTARVITTTPLPTYTPLPTHTLRPSQTPWIVTATPDSFTATPTQENTPPPPTFTVTPDPLKKCTFRANHPTGASINMRTGPGVGFPKAGIWSPGVESEFIQFQEDANYLWGKHAVNLWSVIAVKLASDPFIEWWVSSTDNSDFCTGVPGWPDWALPDPVAVAVNDGVHLLAGEGASAVAPYALVMHSAKCTDGIYNLCLQMKQANPRLVIIARTYSHDCVPVAMLSDASQWWSQIKDILPNGFDFYEIENECAPPAEMYGQWAYFSIEMAKLVARDKGGALLAFSFGPGWPDYPLLASLIPYFVWADQNIAPNGFHHGVAFHSAPYATFVRADMPWVNAPHIAGRMNYIRLTILGAGGPDLKTWSGEIWITEIGLSDGYSGNWNAPYTCDELANAYHTTDIRYGEEGMIDGFNWWNFGKAGRWTDDSRCSVQIWG